MRIGLSRAFFYNNLGRNLHLPLFSTLFYHHRWIGPLTRPCSSFAMTDTEFNREELEDLLKRRFFISRAFDIYGGVAGLYDLGVTSQPRPRVNL
jgi:hypothetical protein